MWQVATLRACDKIKALYAVMRWQYRWVLSVLSSPLTSATDVDHSLPLLDSTLVWNILLSLQVMYFSSHKCC